MESKYLEQSSFLSPCSHRSSSSTGHSSLGSMFQYCILSWPVNFYVYEVEKVNSVLQINLALN